MVEDIRLATASELTALAAEGEKKVNREDLSTVLNDIISRVGVLEGKEGG